MFESKNDARGKLSSATLDKSTVDRLEGPNTMN